MTDNQNSERIDPETLSTNFYYTVGNEETFNCQMTVRGNPTPAEVQTHVLAALSAMKFVVEKGGHAKQVGTPQPSKPTGNGAGAFKFTTYKGKPQVEMLDPNAAYPEAVSCPLHDVTAKGQEGQYGWYWSHKHEGEWCRIGLKKK